MSYKFIKEHDPENPHDITNVIVEVIDNSACKQQLLVSFAEFLKACGYTVKGNIEEVEDE